MGSTPSPGLELLLVITGPVLPLTTVVPEMLDRNGSVCATWLAYSGAARQASRITRNTTAPAIALRLPTSRRSAVRHGPPDPQTGGATNTAPPVSAASAVAGPARAAEAVPVSPAGSVSGALT